MTNKQVEKRVKKAFSGAVPGNFEQILNKCQNTEKEEKIIKMPKRNNRFLKQMISVAAVLALVITAGFTGYNIANYTRVDSVISFDVNPSIEIELSDDEKIVKASARNKDGEKILGNMNLEGSDLSVAVNAIIGSMLRNGYLDEISNSILVSVDCKDEKKGKELEKRLLEEISMLLSGESFDAAVISQTVDHSKEIEKLAEEYGITKGKAQLIQQIIKSDSNKYTFKALAPLTINELNLLAAGEEVDLTANGTASEKKYIGKSRAKKIVLKDDKVSSGDISDYKCKLKLKDGRMVYDISFKTEMADYEYIVNAVNGKIIKSEIERKPIASNPDPDQETEITVDEASAKAKAFELAGVAETDVLNYACVLNEDTEIPYYTISFSVAEMGYSYNINAFTGELMTISTEDTTEDGSSPDQTPGDTTTSQPSDSSGVQGGNDTTSSAQNS